MATKVGNILKKVKNAVVSTVKNVVSTAKNVVKSGNLGASAINSKSTKSNPAVITNLKTTTTPLKTSEVNKAVTSGALTPVNKPKTTTDLTKLRTTNNSLNMSDVPKLSVKTTGTTSSGSTSRSSGSQSGAQAMISSLGSTVAPSSTGSINSGISSPSVPYVKPTIGNATAAMAYNTANQVLDEKNESEFDRMQRVEAERIQAAAAEKKGVLDTIFGKQKTPSEIREDAADEIGFNAKQNFAERAAARAEINELSLEYNRVKEAMDMQIAQSTDKLASNNFINNQIAQIERNAAPKLNRIAADINVKQANEAMLRGDFEDAQSFMREAVTLATADTKYKLDVANAYDEANKPVLDFLDEKYKTAMTEYLRRTKEAHEQDVKNKENVADLMLNYNYLGAGIKLTDTYEQAVMKAARFDRTPSKGGGGGSSNKIESSVREDLYALIYDQKLSAQEAYTRLRTLYSRSEISDSQLQAIVGIGGLSNSTRPDQLNLQDSINSGGLQIDSVYNSLFK